MDEIKLFAKNLKKYNVLLPDAIIAPATALTYNMVLFRETLQISVR